MRLHRSLPLLEHCTVDGHRSCCLVVLRKPVPQWMWTSSDSHYIATVPSKGPLLFAFRVPKTRHPLAFGLDPRDAVEAASLGTTSTVAHWGAFAGPWGHGRVEQGVGGRHAVVGVRWAGAGVARRGQPCVRRVDGADALQACLYGVRWWLPLASCMMQEGWVLHARVEGCAWRPSMAGHRVARHGRWAPMHVGRLE